jgi:hypothetical protein
MNYRQRLQVTVFNFSCSNNDYVKQFSALLLSVQGAHRLKMNDFSGVLTANGSFVCVFVLHGSHY